MLSRLILPAEFEAWNDHWGAPHGRVLPRWLAPWIRRVGLDGRPEVLRRIGPFGFQANNQTRRWEYPWAFHAVDLNPGMVVVDLGGALSGFQFALAEAKARVINVDPFVDYGSSEPYDGVDPSPLMARLNRAFRTDVELRRATIDRAGLADSSVEVVYCLSTLEHLPLPTIDDTLGEVRRVLSPGGRLVMTVDLFLDLEPFTTRTTNRFGSNLDLGALVGRSGLELVVGNPAELYGFPEFDAGQVQSKLADYLIGSYPGIAQCLVLRKL